jgi:hypothetical protein
MNIVNLRGLLSHNFKRKTRTCLYLTTQLIANCNLSGHTYYLPEVIFFYHWAKDRKAGGITVFYAAVMVSALQQAVG